MHTVFFIGLFDCYGTKRTAIPDVLMLCEYEFFMVYEPGQAIFHHKKKRIYFCAGPAADAQAVIYIRYQNNFFLLPR